MKYIPILLLLCFGCSSIDKSKPYTVVWANKKGNKTLYTIENNKRLYRVFSSNGKIVGDTIKFKI